MVRNALLVLLAAAWTSSAPRYEVGANSGNDGGAFTLDTRSGTARYFSSDGRPFGKPMALARAEAGPAGSFALGVNSGALGGAWILDTRSGTAGTFKPREGQLGPNFSFGQDAEPGPPGTFAISANSGDRGGAYILDTRTGVARMISFEGHRLRQDVRFGGEAGEPGRYAHQANSGVAEGVFLLDTRVGLCRYFHGDGKQVGRDVRFEAAPPEGAGSGRYRLSVNSGEAGGVFLLDSRAGVARYFHVDGRQFGRDVRLGGEEAEGRYALSANSGPSGGVFLLDTNEGIARYFHVADGRQIGRDITFPETKPVQRTAGRFALSANSGGWGGVVIQDTESGVARYFRVDGSRMGPDLVP